MRELTATFVPSATAAQTLRNLVAQAEAAVRAGNLPAARAASKAYEDAARSGIFLPIPCLSPVRRAHPGGLGLVDVPVFLRR